MNDKLQTRQTAIRFSKFLFVLWIMTFGIMNAQWVPTNGPAGGEIYSIVVKDGNLFAGANDGGIFLSTDNGTSWTAANSGLGTTRDIYCLAVKGENLFAGGNRDGVFLSTDNGSSWTVVKSGLPNNGDIFSLAVSGDNIFAGTDGDKVFRSTNNGNNWTQVGTGLPNNRDILAMAVSDTNIFAGNFNSGVYRTTNNGTNWTAANTGLTNLKVQALAINDTNLYAGTQGGVFLSTNNGASWTAVNNGLTNLNILSLTVSGSNLLAGSNGGGVFLSTDNGATWTAVNSGLSSLNVLSLNASGTNIFAGTNGSGVFLTTDNGASWNNTGLMNLIVWCFAVNGDSIYSGTNGNGVFLTTDSGTSWAAINSGLTNLFVRAFTFSGSNLFAGTIGGVFLSTDYGTSWTAVNTGLTNTTLRTLTVKDTNLFAGTAGGGVFLSTNNGTSWTAVNNGLTQLFVSSLVFSGDNLFAGMSGGGGVFLSTDNGTSWTAVNTGLTTLNITSLALDGTNLFAGTPGGGVFLTTDNGTSWTAVNNGLTNTNVQSLTVSGTNLFAGTTNGGVFISPNNGTNWYDVSSGLPSATVSAFTVSSVNLFSGTNGSSVWLRPIDEMVSTLPPLAPGNLIAVADTFYVTLSWTDISDNELGFWVERKDDSLHLPGNWIVIDSVGENAVSYIDSGLTSNSVYSYRVFAYNLFGESPSDSIEVTTLAFTPTTFSFNVPVTNGWNMVSAPGLNTPDQNVSTWWPNLTGTVWGFNGTIYQARTVTTPGEGYWMKNVGSESYSYTGIEIVTHDAIAATAGWNMIGGYETSVATSGLTTVPSGQQTGTIWGFNGTVYTAATTFEPGKGYWVKTLSACDIVIPEALSKGSGEVVDLFKEDWGKIILTDAAGKSYTLYAVKGEVNLDQYEMPPAVPGGMFDIRFSSGRIAEDINSSMQSIDMIGITYPLTVRVEGMEIRLQDMSGRTINQNLKSGEEVVINDATINKLMITGELIPTVYALEQNYPNPFNPSTVIEFSLPEDVSNVKLSIYNALGEKVAEIVNSSLAAGRYSYQWNAKNVATGMYIYELRTDKFVSVKKMLLLK